MSQKVTIYIKSLW